MVLMHLCAKAGLNPDVVCLDHGLRPESADEVRWVRQAAQGLGLPFFTRQLHLSPGSALAARARMARTKVWNELHVDHVLLAHHQNDQAETVLDRLTRGAGARGLSGMALRSGRLVRPLLQESRLELEDWANRQGIAWVEDPSNTKGTRGWMRHRVLPLLEERRPGSTACIARSATHLAQDEAVLSGLAADLIDTQGIALDRLRAAAPSLQRRAVAQLLERERGDRQQLSARLLDLSLNLLDSKGGAVELGGGWRLILHAERVYCLPPKPLPAELQQGVWGPWRLVASQTVGVRSVEPGERMNGRRVVDLMREVALPSPLRAYLPIIHLGPQRWLPGVSFQGEAPLGVHVKLEDHSGGRLLGGGPFQRLI